MVGVAEPNVSDVFLSSVRRAVAASPENIRDRLRAYGVIVCVGELSTDIFPELKGVQPRGWSAGSTWEMCGASYSPMRRIVAIAEREATLVESGKVIDSEPMESLEDYMGGVPHIVHHEIGHALEYAAGKHSKSQEFRAAYCQDLKRLMWDSESVITPDWWWHLQGDAHRLRYFIQPQNGSLDIGASEAFAEGYACIVADDTSPMCRDFHAAFPGVVNHIREAFLS